MQFAQRLLSTRGGTIAVSILAAILAAVILVTYLHRYRSSVRASGLPVSVLVANGLIEKGTSGQVIANEELYKLSSVPKGEVSEGAITDPDALKGKVATADVFPGEQLTVAKFSVDEAGSLSNDITGDQRVVTLPFDSSHGLLGKVQAGDHIDVYAGFNVRKLGPDGRPEPGVAERAVLKLITPDVDVLAVPDSSSGGIGGGTSKARLTIRASDQDAAKMAFTADNGILWAILRPRANATPTSPNIVSVETVLFGIPPVQVEKSLGVRR
jgi:Flp pilus assembly protein CpaB